MYKEGRLDTFHIGDVVYISEISGVGIYSGIRLGKFEIISKDGRDYKVILLDDYLSPYTEVHYKAEFSPSWMAKTLDEAIQELADYDRKTKDKIVKLIFEYKQ